MDLAVTPLSIAATAQFTGQTPQLAAGQIVDATVLAILKDGLVRIAIADLQLDVRSEVPLAPGTTLRFAVKGGPEGLRLVAIPGSVHPPKDGAPPVGRRPPSEPSMSTVPEPSAREVRGSAQAPPGAAPKAASPAEAVANAVRTAALRQGGLAPLFASLAALVERSEQAAPPLAPAPPGPAASVVNNIPAPEPVRQIAERLLASRLPLNGGLTAETLTAALKNAFSGSGLFLEQRLAQGESPHADLKALLSALRQATRAWLDTAPEGGVSAGVATPRAASPQVMAEPVQPLPPPYRGAPMVAQPVAPASISEDMSPQEVARRLLDQTEAALSRQTLLQAASLPDAGSDPAQPDQASARWLFEAPLAMPQGTGIGQFEISRDGRGSGPDALKPVWRARFSITIEPLGPVHAQVSLAGSRASVTLWAEREEAADTLRTQVGQLAQSLAAEDLEPGEVVVRAEKPRVPAPARHRPGRFLDRAT